MKGAPVAVAVVFVFGGVAGWYLNSQFYAELMEAQLKLKQTVDLGDVFQGWGGGSLDICGVQVTDSDQPAGKTGNRKGQPYRHPPLYRLVLAIGLFLSGLFVGGRTGQDTDYSGRLLASDYWSLWLCWLGLGLGCTLGIPATWGWWL